MRVITFSRFFPKGHPKEGQPTFFVEKIWESIYLMGYSGWDGFSDIAAICPQLYSHGTYPPKHHTIRAGNRWKVGDKFSPRVWSGKPYASKQIIIAPDIEIKKVWDVRISFVGSYIYVEKPISKNAGLLIPAGDVALNDGLSYHDFFSWFGIKKKLFEGQIICWSNDIDY